MRHGTRAAYRRLYERFAGEKIAGAKKAEVRWRREMLR
jgi:hypothetical protein